MTHAHKPEFTYWDEFSEDGLTTSRRGVLGTPIPRYSPTPAAAPARNEVARPVTLARAPAQSELLKEAQRLFDSMGVHLPQRINTEELGDALEVLHEMEREGQPKWRLQARILSTLFWVIAHTAQDGVHSLIETGTAATGNNSGKGHE
jgi:hypothetical protein